MKKNMMRWQINRHATFTSFRTFFLMATLFVLILVYSFAFTEEKVLYPRLFIIILAYTGLSLATINLYRSTKTSFITIEDDLMLIPRLARKPTQLKLSNVTSVQKLYFSEKLVSILIFQKSLSPVLIEQRFFYSKNEFNQCVDFLNTLSFKNQSPESTERTSSVSLRKTDQNAWRADILAAFLILAYCSSLTGEIDRIDIEIITYGGLSKKLFTSHEYYRFFTSFFLHYSPFHLLPNVISLSIIGRYIVKIFGTVRFINIVFFSAICGSILSLAFSPYEIVIGASGGIFGLIGALLYTRVRFPSQLPDSISISIKTTLFILAVQMAFDLLGTGGDIFSHFGGAAFGFFYALCVFRKFSISDVSTALRPEIFTSAILAIFYIAGLFYLFQ